MPFYQCMTLDHGFIYNIQKLRQDYLNILEEYTNSDEEDKYHQYLINLIEYMGNYEQEEIKYILFLAQYSVSLDVTEMFYSDITPNIKIFDALLSIVEDNMDRIDITTFMYEMRKVFENYFGDGEYLSINHKVVFDRYYTFLWKHINGNLYGTKINYYFIQKIEELNHKFSQLIF